MRQRRLLPSLLILTVLSLVSCSSVPAPGESPRVLLVTGGGWHDYEAQTPALLKGLDERIPGIDWTIVHEGNGQPDYEIPLLQEEGWADDYDLVIHNTGFGRVKNAEFVRQLVAQHKGTPAVLIHSAVHSYRYATPAAEEWFRFSGVQSMWHETERVFRVDNLAPAHPIMQGFPSEWTTPVTEELYVVEKVWGEITPLAQAHGVETGTEHPVVWTHTAEGVRVFATTLGHNAAIFEQPVYLDLIARGVRWALEAP